MDDIILTALFFKAIETKDFHTLTQMLHPDFLYFGPTPDPFNKETWINFQRAIQYAFPDWSYNISKLEKKVNCVEATVHITGSHLKELKLPLEGVKPILPTGKKIEMPIEHAWIKCKESKIKELRVENQFHGSLPGLLQQLGVE